MSEKRKQTTLNTFFDKPLKTQKTEKENENVQKCGNDIDMTSYLPSTSKDESNSATELNEEFKFNWPHVWSTDMWTEKKKAHPWLTCDAGKLGCLTCAAVKKLGPSKTQGVNISKEWCSVVVSSYGQNRSAQLTSLRKKINEHSKSISHIQAEKILKTANEQQLEAVIDQMNDSEISSTCKVFRTAYYIAKHDRPYSDHFDLLLLQQLNGTVIAHGLRSRFSSTNIIEHVARQMKLKLCQQILDVRGNFSIVIDESTTLSKNSTLIIYLKCETDKIKDPHYLFLDLIELPDQTAFTITDCLLKCLKKYGFDDNYLKYHLISFTSDGASVMLGRKSGVGKRLLEKYPNLIIWHCLNHRLELSVGDAIAEVHGINHFQIFMDKLYTLYSQSPKNQREIEACATNIGEEIKKIGRIFNVRWVASSFRTVSAVWQNFASLCHHFENASKDNQRNKTEQSMFIGLHKRITSKQFVLNLALMYDVLFQISILSESLQKRDATIVYADKLIRRTILYLELLKNPQTGKKLLEATEAIEKMQLFSVTLTDNQKVTLIHRNQFLPSIINHMKHRLNVNTHSTEFTEGVQTSDIIKELRILEPSEWPSEIDLQFGENEIESLCKRFSISFRKCLNAYRDYLANGGRSVPTDLEQLKSYTKIIACSSSECERGFSNMNLILTEKRSRILVEHVASYCLLNNTVHH